MFPSPSPSVKRRDSCEHIYPGTMIEVLRDALHDGGVQERAWVDHGLCCAVLPAGSKVKLSTR